MLQPRKKVEKGIEMARQSHKKYEFEQIVVDVTVASKMTEAQKKVIEKTREKE